MLGHGIVIWRIKVTAHVAHIFNSDHTQCHMPTANAACKQQFFDSLCLMSAVCHLKLLNFYTNSDSPQTVEGATVHCLY